MEALPLYSVCVALHEGRLQSTVESGVPPSTARTRARCSRCGLWRQYIGDTRDRSSPQRSALWSLPLHFLTIVISAVRIPRDPPPPLAAQSAWVSEEGALAARYDFSSEEGTFHPSGPWVLHHSHFISSHQLSSALISSHQLSSALISSHPFERGGKLSCNPQLCTSPATRLLGPDANIWQASMRTATSGLVSARRRIHTLSLALLA